VAHLECGRERGPAAADRSRDRPGDAARRGSAVRRELRAHASAAVHAAGSGVLATAARVEVVDSSVAGDLAALKAVRDGDFTIDSRDVKDAKWIVSYNVPDGPIYYYVYDRATKRGELLFTHRPKLEQ